jgi:hypothetical protein
MNKCDGTVCRRHQVEANSPLLSGNSRLGGRSASPIWADLSSSHPRRPAKKCQAPGGRLARGSGSATIAASRRTVPPRPIVAFQLTLHP